MDKKTAGVLVGVLLIGIVSAGLVPYLSNMVSGSVTVEGPVFYATSGNNLLINEFDDSDSWYDIDDGQNEVFLTQELNEPLDFYKPSLNMYLRAKVVEESTTLPKNLKLEFGYFDSEEDFNKICEGEVSVSSIQFQQYSILGCVGNSELTDVNGFYYRITGMATSEVTCRILVSYGETKVEMDRAT